MSLNEDVERAAQRSTELAEMSDAQRIDLLRSELAETKAALDGQTLLFQDAVNDIENNWRPKLEAAEARIAALEGEFTRLNDSLGGALREVIDLRNEKMCLQVAACSIEARAERAEAECKALREVLQFYGNKAYYDHVILVDHGDKARAALNPKESSNGP